MLSEYYKIVKNEQNLEQIKELFKKSKIVFRAKDPSTKDIMPGTIQVNYKTEQMYIFDFFKEYGKLAQLNVNTGKAIVTDLQIHPKATTFWPLINSPNDIFKKFQASQHNNPEYKEGFAYFTGDNAIEINFGYKLKVPFGYTGQFKATQFNGSNLVIAWDYGGRPGGSEFDYHFGLSNGRVYVNVGAHNYENTSESHPVDLNKQYFFALQFLPNGVSLKVYDKDFTKIFDTFKDVQLTASMSTKVAFGAQVWDINYSGFANFFRGQIAGISLYEQKFDDSDIELAQNISKKQLFK